MKYRAFLLLLALSGCRPPAEMNPWLYAPSNQQSAWISRPSEEKKIRKITLKVFDHLPTEANTLNLFDLFQIGLQNNPNTAKTFSEAQTMAATYGASRSSYYPQLSLSAEYLRQKQGFVFTDNEVFTIDSTTMGPEGVLTYTFIDFTRTPTVNQNFFMSLSANWTHNEELQKVMKQIADVYYDTLYQKQLLTAYQADLKDAFQTYESAEEKYRFGINDLTELMQAKSQYLQKQINVSSQEAKVKNALVQLNQTVGMPGDTEYQLADFPTPDEINTNELKPQELIELAKEMRSDLKAAKSKILSQQAAIQVAEGQFWPTITGQGTLGQSWFNGNVTDNGNWSYQFNASIPLFTGFYNTNNLRVAKSNLREAKAELEALELEVISQVMSSYNNLLSSLNQLRYTQEYLEAAQIDYKGAFESYNAGTKDILYLANAIAFLSDARAKQAHAIQQYYTSKTDLTFAIGKLSDKGD